MSNTVTINPKHTYTKSEYSRAYNINRTTLDKMIANKELKVLPVRGTLLILAQQG